MTDVHQLRVGSPKRRSLETVSDDFQIKKLLWARDKTWEVYGEIKNSLREGMTEKDAFDLSRKIFADHGVKKHWHKPYVRFGAGTLLTFHHPLQEAYTLQENDPVYIDLGPAWQDGQTGQYYEGDVGDTFVFGDNKLAEECAAAARDIFFETEREYNSDQLSGAEIFKLMKQKVVSKGYLMTENVQGHRISDFPHHQYSKEKLGELDFSPSKLLWVLEVHLKHPEKEIGAFFEDILGADRRVPICNDVQDSLQDREE